MSTLNAILNTGAGSLNAQQTAINVSGNNISNVNTTGYSRQQVEFQSADPLYGGGVAAVTTTRVCDAFINSRICLENQDLGECQARMESLEKVEMIFNETENYGLNNALNEFWNSWSDLSNNPSGTTERVVLTQNSLALAQTLNQQYAELEKTQDYLNREIESAVNKINTMTGEIADLNEKISAAEINGQTANEFRDQRDLLLKDLSTLVDVETFEDDNHMVALEIAGGNPLVQGTSTWELTAEAGTSGSTDVVWNGHTGQSEVITDDISGGKLKGWIQVRDEDIPETMKELDELASILITEINNLHISGYGLDGSTGNAFLVGTGADDITVNPDILDDPQLIAASSSGDDVPGNNDTALALAGLRDENVMNGGTSTFIGYYSSMVTEVGLDVYTSQTNYEYQREMVSQLENYRESVSGVSVDEEMINLVKFQAAYDAAARLISIVDEMMETVINM